MKYEITKNEFEYTGGGCWVLFSEIWLPGEKKMIFATTDDSYVFIYYNENNFRECMDPDDFVCSEYIDESPSKYKTIAVDLFDRFERLREIHKYD